MGTFFETQCRISAGYSTGCRLLANLTQPAIVCFQGHLPEEKTRRNYYMEVEEQLQMCKQVGSHAVIMMHSIR